MVYLIQAGEHGPVKIGYSKTVASALSRLTLFQPGCPEELRLVRVLDGDKEREKALHLQFADLQIHGEWFHASPELLALGEAPDEIERADVLPISFRWGEAFIARIDEARGDVPRSAFVRRAVEQALVGFGDAPRQRAHTKTEDDVAITPAPAEQPQTPDFIPDGGMAPLSSYRSAARSSVQAKRDVRPVPKAGE